MEIKKLSATELPKIDLAVKECINLGQWLLFKSATRDQENFFLRAGTTLLTLDELGAIIHTADSVQDDVGVDEVFYFDDVVKPQTLSTNF